MDKASLAEKKKTYDAQRPSTGKKRGDIFAAWPRECLALCQGTQLPK